MTNSRGELRKVCADDHRIASGSMPENAI